ncbi:CAP-Gly domain-containing linker protein 2 isoform X3 [Gymnodraco acuticeps]|uniref:CAP-Gly domain-containing linker protein 2 isoform X3 n=1 Tax=Gymnodraco acuticeps TaxID=8218 RepID=A0A6P8TBC4_GYMAC|nr:CAP-Gly domain-containing linker protein 2 isoform X3 [Gymnodraco acuticeps]
MNMLKSSGLKIPGRGPKHASPSPGGPGRTSSPVPPKDNTPLKPTTPTKITEEGDEVLGDYTVGETVWVNGVKLGVIAYLGETQFAPGQWAGVILNDLVGKNDGSVGGVRYFECQALQGIFTRPSKLNRQQAGEGSDSHSIDSQNQGGNGVPPPSQRVVVMPLREGLLNSTIRTGNESGSNMSDSGSVKKGGDKDLRVGDRVLVGGSKMGVIRYMGETDFAKGEWCGVELDEPLGKNDGAVAGTRYFQCFHKFGLFAPIHKVIRIGFPSTSPAKAKKSKRMAMGVSSLAHSPSSSSISSVSSVASSVGGRPSRTGLLTETSSRYARKISGTTALQEALKEKQQHIEQLLAERDSERAEMAKATTHIQEVEKELSSFKVQHVTFVSENDSALQQIKTLLTSTQKDKLELTNQLEEEKRKVEDLQFRVEEECITKGDLEGRGSHDAASLRLGKRTKQTTVEEQSRIVQLEEELSLRRAEMENLQVKLRGSDSQQEDGDEAPGSEPETLILRVQLASAGREHNKESSELREKHEAELEERRQEVAELRAELENKSRELSEVKLKVQDANRENVQMMDTWKDKFDSLVVQHQRSLEDLKASLSGDHPAAGGPEQASLESLKTEHQLEVENLKAKHKIEAAILTKEREDFCTRLAEAKEQLDKGSQSWRSEAEAKSSRKALEEAGEKLQRAERRLAEVEKIHMEKDRNSEELRERLELSEKKMSDYQALQNAQAESQQEIQKLEEQLRVTANQLQATQADRYTSNDANVIEDNDITEEKMKLKQNVEETMEKLMKREKEVTTLTSQVEGLKSQIGALEGKVRSGEKKAEALARENVRVESELESMTKKSHDASGQLVNISQELLKKERSLNELRVLLLESHRHSRDMEKDMTREVHKAEWKVKEQKLQEDIKTLREKLLLLGRERSSPDHRRHSMLDPSMLDSEMSRLRQRLLGTEDALRGAMEHNQQVDQLVLAMRRHPEKSPVHGVNSANGIHHQESGSTRDEQH